MIGSATKKWLQDYSVSLTWTLVFLVLIANSVLSYINFRHVAQSTDQVKNQYEMMLLTDQIEKLLLNAETGHRGYVITQRDSYLQPYDQALNLLDAKLTAPSRVVHG
ncbi:MAG: CHASE3 domain-containing protein [Gemmatales bacterium]